MWRSVASNGLTLFIVLLAVAAGVIAWAKNQYVAPGPLAQAICLRVESGSNMGKVSAALEAQGAVTSGWLFRVGADYSGRADRLKAGSYLVPQNASMQSIVAIVTDKGVSTCGTEVVYRIGVKTAETLVRELDPNTNRFLEVASFDPAAGEAPAEYARVTALADTRYRVATAEGATVWQIVEALKRAEFITGEVKDMPAEGSLAPDSYEVTRGSDINDLLGRMIEAQTARLDEAWRNRAEGLPYGTPAEALVMASIVEKETGVPEERGKVASVFVNRLRQGIPLQTDPSVIYGVTEGRGNLGRGLRQSELRKETPYNTYLIQGLPPTPIANPGQASIEAALNPETTDFLYFVADGSGGHAFAATLAEHNSNVARWREIEAQQGLGGDATGTGTADGN